MENATLIKEMSACGECRSAFATPFSAVFLAVGDASWVGGGRAV